MPRASRRAGALWRAIACGLLFVGLTGCVGVRTSRFEWREATAGVTIRRDALDRFGEPLRKAREDDLEVWYYLVDGAPPTVRPLPARERVSMIGAIVLLWRVTRAKENLRFAFSGENVVATSGLAEQTRGAICGLLIVRGVHFGCSGD